MQYKEVTKYSFIDALRAVAIILVIFMHTHLSYPSSFEYLRIVAERSGHGVQLFYLLSAFTLFLSLGERSSGSSSVSLRGFYIRRFFRIAPLFYPALVIYAVYYYSDIDSITHTGIQRWQWAWTPSGIKWWHFILSALFLNGWMPETLNTIIPVGWSVAVEMTFYMLVPLLFKYIKNIWQAVLFIIITLIAQAGLTLWLKPMVIDAYTGPGRVVSFFFENWFFSQLPIFALGILAYFIFVKIRHTTSPELGWVLIICSSFFFFNLLTINEVYGAFLPELFYYGLIFLLIIIGVYLAAPAIIINPFTIWVGRISFSLYLIHFIVIDFLLTIFPAGIIGLGKTINFFVFFIFTIILSCLISHITYKYIEAPGMQAGRTLIQKLNKTSRSHTANI